MNTTDFWASITSIIDADFTPEGLLSLDSYAADFISGRLVYQRFSPQQQYGCSAGGNANVIATLLAGAEDCANRTYPPTLSDYQRERQRGAKQEEAIEKWAKVVGLWTEHVEDQLSQTLGDLIAQGGEAEVYDHGSTLIKSIGLDYFIQPVFALDRITLHNTFFPETALKVIGFGRNQKGEFKILAEQPFICGEPISEPEIEEFMRQMGFELKNPRNWTYVTPEIYLSDLHDENVIRSSSGIIFVVDCDIRFNTPELRQGGIRTLSNHVRFIN